jgi:hypothetical protein
MKLGYIIAAGVAVVVVGDIFLLSHNRSQEDAWEAFREAHHCTAVGVLDGSNRAGYKCDDGQVHYRWRQMR